MFRSSLRLLWTCSFVLAFTALALAAPISDLHGTVFDPSGAAIPHAQVELLEDGAPVATTVTDAKGQYSISRRPGPNQSLRVTAQGFSVQQKSIAKLPTGRDLTVDFTLALAAFSDQVTVTSTGLPTPQSQLGAAVTVLDTGDLQGTQELEERLRYVPGLQTNHVGQAGGSTGLFIRGGGPDANKTLIDGIAMNDIGGLVEYANVASAAVSQIEVLRGPNSALYGPDAMAGVVSISTPRGATALPLFTYAVNGGNFGSYSQDGSVSGIQGKLDYFADYFRFDTRNSIPGNTVHDGTLAGNFGWALTPASSLRATIHHDQDASGQPNAIELYGIPDQAKTSNEDAYFGVTLEDETTRNWNNLIRYGGVRLRSDYIEFAPVGTPQYEDYLTYLPCTPQTDPNCVIADYLGAPVTLTGANGYTVSGQAQYNYPGTYPSYDPGSTDKDFVYAQSDYQFLPSLRGLFAFRYEDERGYSYGQANAVERGNYSYTMEVQGDFHGRLFYTLGGGLEDNGLFGFAATPRASLAWQVAGSTKLRASFGKGIKEPAVFDQLESLYALLDQNGYTNLIAQYHISPIGPEYSRSYDGGVDRFFSSGRTRLSLSLFHNEFTGGIEYVPSQGLTELGLPVSIIAVANATYYGATVNTKAYFAQGIEAEFESQLTRSWFARGGYTYTDAKIQHSFSSDNIGPSNNPSFPTIDIGAYSPLDGARPFRVAPHTGYFQAGYRQGKLFAALSGSLVSKRDDSDFLEYDANGGQTMLLPNRNLDGAYQQLDLNTSYQATHMVSVEGNFQNLLCEHFSEAFGYPSLPFTIRMGVKLTLGGESWPWK